MKISVIISTYNRFKDLKHVLDLLYKQKYDGSFDYEIIVVDNNSKDKTKETVGSFIKRDSKFKYVFEQKQGLSNARNTGINHSKGEILAFTDDDVEISENFLLNIALFSKEYDFDAVGGKVLPIYPSQTPDWIKNNRELLSGPILCHDYGETIKLYDMNMVPFVGANMIVKRKVIDVIGGFNIHIGAGSGALGEDTEFFRRIQKANLKIYYNPSILIFHPVDKKRMSLIYIAKWNISLGRYSGLIDYKTYEGKKLICYFGIPRYLILQLFKILFPSIFLIFNKTKFISLWCSFFKQWGRIQAHRLKVTI